MFVGGTNDRAFRAFDAKTGELVWQQKMNLGIIGMPVAYQVGATEHVAMQSGSCSPGRAVRVVQSGGGVDAQRIQDGQARTPAKLDPVVEPQGGGVWVFAIRRRRLAYDDG
jgi:alcohol dehydrogenase (cytochrome c)